MHALLILTSQYEVSIKYLDVCKLFIETKIFDELKEIKDNTGAKKHEGIPNFSLVENKQVFSTRSNGHT